jgi:surface carbohydrate biosynthesis protein
VAPARPTLIIPVEIQVRELDSKLLLACAAAERGFVSYLGHRTQVDEAVARLPRGTYLSKSMTRRSTRMFRILRKLGHEIGVWDEEALVYPSAEHYFRRRMSAEALAHVSFLLAWGRDNLEMFRKFPGYDGTPIHVTGHPRIDLLRPELRGFFDAEVAAIRERHGRFVLVNTNFSKVNGFRHRLEGGLPVPPAPRGGAPGPGGLAPGYLQHKRALFDAFREMVPALGSAFPGRKLVVRPHPNERPEPWQAAAAAHPNVCVVHDGNVVPWLLACDALVHNGCTTAVEAFALDRPAIAYCPVTASEFDSELPNALSHECRDLDGLAGLVARSEAGELPRAPGDRGPRPVEEFLASLAGELASDRVVDVVADVRPGGGRGGRRRQRAQAPPGPLAARTPGRPPRSAAAPPPQGPLRPGDEPPLRQPRAAGPALHGSRARGSGGAHRPLRALPGPIRRRPGRARRRARLPDRVTLRRAAPPGPTGPTALRTRGAASRGRSRT